MPASNGWPNRSGKSNLGDLAKGPCEEEFEGLGSSP